MRFAQEKRRLLGWLALLAPLPLPLNEPRPTGVVSWLFLLLWILVVVLFLRRVKRGETRWLGVRSLNLLGLAYLPFLALDLSVSGANLLIRPMMHLAMFALAAKLFSMERERDKWHALLGIFFIFVTSVATSTSLGIVVYLVAFLIMGAGVLGRFSSLHMESFVETPGDAERVPVATANKKLLMLTLVLTIPLFILLPRFGDPFLFGGGSGSSITGTGFSDEVSLDGIGRIRSSSEVALRLVYEAPVPTRSERENVRFRGAAYDLYQGTGWQRAAGNLRVPVVEGGFVAVGVGEGASGETVTSAEVWLEPLDARAVIVPNRTLRIHSPSRIPLLANRAGALSFPIEPSRAVRYRVDLGAQPRQWAEPPDLMTDPTLDLAGVSPRIRELADLVVEDTSGAAAAARIERHLQTEYDYQLELLGGGDKEAIERFLFERRSGHCEYFASAMVLMLRSQEIPSRFVTGFLGAEVSATGYSIVRQSNAHAWVEAYLPGRGWVEFDPTPPAGLPSVGSRSFLGVFRQAYDWMSFSWDRYVVGFGSGQQRRFVARVVAWIKDLLRVAEVDETDDLPRTTAVQVEPEASREVPEQTDGTGWTGMASGLAVLLFAWLIFRWRRGRFDAAAGYLTIRRAAEKAGIEGDRTPLAFAHQVARRFPSAAEPVKKAVVLYLQDSFSGETLSRQELEQLRLESRRARRCIEQAARKAS